MPVPVCVAVTSTPGNTAPVTSRAVPLICAVACAQASAQAREHPSNIVKTEMEIRFVIFLLLIN
jgi:hypothetical protein